MNLSIKCLSHAMRYYSKKNLLFSACLLFLITPAKSSAQQQMSDYVLFSGNGGAGTTASSSPGYGVQLGSSSSVTGGSTGSLKLVKTTGNCSLTRNIYAGGTVVLANGNSVTGKITAANSTLEREGLKAKTIRIAVQ